MKRDNDLLGLGSVGIACVMTACLGAFIGMAADVVGEPEAPGGVADTRGPNAAYDPYADPDPAEAPALWKLSDEDNTIYLFGTIHLLPPGVEWLTPAYEAAMQDAGITFAEADVESPEALAAVGPLIQALGFNPSGVTLSATLGEERAAKFSALSERYGVPIAALETMRPWLAILTVTQLVFNQTGLDANSGVDKAVLAAAREQDDTLGYFETAEVQVRALVSFDEEEILKGFDEDLEELLNLEAVVLKLVDAWRKGDLAWLEAELITETRKETPKTFKALFTDRNAAWTRQIEEMMAGDQNHFIAVGVGHLVGDQSVIDMLVKRGFKPVRIQ
ncbi:MAG: TraB/GumN family protein [Planctomycetota bacterium]